MGNTYFKFLGALLLFNVIFYGANVLHVQDTKISWLNAALALGMAWAARPRGMHRVGKSNTFWYR